VKLKNFGVGQVEYTLSKHSYKNDLLANHMWMEGSMAQPLDATTKCNGMEIRGTTKKFGEFKQGAQTGWHMPFRR
jgi:hypothetical protein